MKQIKLKSFGALSSIANPDKLHADKWIEFLRRNGHTVETFSYLPDSLQLSMKVSFNKKALN